MGEILLSDSNYDERKMTMAPKGTSTKQQKETQTIRAPGMRSFYRNTLKKMTIIPENKDLLSSKELDCCVQATD